MDVGLLYSGGKDSTLAALLLDRVADVTLLCGSFGVTDDYEHARGAAADIGLPSERLALDSGVAETAVEQLLADGYPRTGIQQVHEHALERAAADWGAIADGTRRDDRAPTVDRPLAQSIEDRFGVSYLAPLAGIGHSAIDALADDHLVVETGPSEMIPKGDYETELRALVRETAGERRVDEIFPPHDQSRVVGLRE